MEDITNIIENTGLLERMESPVVRKSPAKSIPIRKLSTHSLRKGSTIKVTSPCSPSKSTLTISSNKSHIPTPTKRRFDDLKVKQSRLDMLDCQFTSFPLAPPPENENVSETLKSPEINAHEVPSRPQSGIFDGDPIVLVEDYIQQKKRARKKLSVSDLKMSLENFHFNDDITGEDNYLTKTRSILKSASHSIRKIRSQHLQRHQLHVHHSPLRQSSLLLTHAHIQGDEDEIESTNSNSSAFVTNNTSQSSYCSFKTPLIKAPSIKSFGSGFNSVPTLKLSDNDLTFGAFSLCTLKSSLKYCIICETPLYDLSSLLTSESNFNEFVCSNCTEKYETLSKLIEDFDESVSDLNPIPENIENIEEALNQPGNKKQKITSEFSVTLINKLQSQLGSKPKSKNVDNISAQWLLSAKKKLRWRWRISGLIPKFLDKSGHYKGCVNYQDG